MLIRSMYEQNGCLSSRVSLDGIVGMLPKLCGMEMKSSRGLVMNDINILNCSFIPFRNLSICCNPSVPTTFYTQKPTFDRIHGASFFHQRSINKEAAEDFLEIISGDRP
jgi:hypothetical protein